ncbi:hypothetical protein TNCV_1882441 [Trichonephila clavipes]|nr:hypothetical protein TNCV_1882441 [Trichonephila clavipes]
MVKISVALQFRILLKTTEKTPRRRIRDHNEQLSRSSHWTNPLKEVVSQWTERRLDKSEIYSSYGAKQCDHLKILTRNGWTVTDFSYMMVAVDLGPQQI